MSYEIPELEYLVDALQSLPGVGRKNAKKWAYHIIMSDSKYVNTFASRLINAKNKIIFCEQCLNVTTQKICQICTSHLRIKNKLCIVSGIEDLNRIEDSANYNGLYFVLHNEVNLKNLNQPLKNLDKLIEYLAKNQQIDEILIATNFTVPGQLTAQKIVEALGQYQNSIYRIGLGLPLNSCIDYADNETIKYSLLNKIKIK